MFGRLIGEIIAAPLRVASIPVKITQKAVEAADEFMLPGCAGNYKAPRRNTIDKVADAVSDAAEEAMD